MTGSSQPTPSFVTHVTDATFETEVLQSDQPVVLDFWAPWCAPCRTLGATLEPIARDYSGRVRVVKLNVDENPRTSEQFGIRSIPTLVYFRDGKPVGATTGALPDAALRKLFDKHASGNLAQ